MPTPSGRWRATDTWRGHDWLRLRCRSAYNCISSPEVVVRTAVQRAVGGYDARCFHTSDLNMWLRIAAVADIAYVRGLPQAIYRIHPGSMLRSQDGPMVDLRERRRGVRLVLRSARRSALDDAGAAPGDGRPRARPPGAVAGEPRLRPRPRGVARTRSPSTSSSRSRWTCTPTAHTPARVARAAAPPAPRRRSLRLVPPVRRDRRGPPPPRHPRPAALARARHLAVVPEQVVHPGLPGG